LLHKVPNVQVSDTTDDEQHIDSLVTKNKNKKSDITVKYPVSTEILIEK